MSTPTSLNSTPAEQWDARKKLLKLYEDATKIKLPTWENPLRLLVTGSRRWTDLLIPAAVLSGLSVPYGAIKLMHGAAPGLDSISDMIAKSKPNWPDPTSVPADWSNGKVGGNMRNEDMVDRGHDICIGFPDAKSTGTIDCLDRAIIAGIPTFYVWAYEIKPWNKVKERQRFRR